MPSPYADDGPSLAAALEGRLSGMQFPLSPATRAAVYEGVCEYVTAAKALGWPPERIIVGMKGIARHAGLRPTANLVRVSSRPTGTDLLLGDMVGWCIRGYYAAAESSRR